MKAPKLHSSLFGVLAGVLLLFCARVPAAGDASWITAGQQDAVLDRIRKALPQGWSIRQEAGARTPDDWYTLDNRAIQIVGSNGTETFQTWVLPLDWVGIRKFRQGRTRVVYWEGILADANLKTITDAANPSIHQALQGVLGRTPSLVNGGWPEAEKLFQHRMAEVDEQVGSLVERFCKDQDCRHEAAYSLIVLGVPSRAITLECAEHGRGEVQQMCTSALGYIGGQDSTRLLETLLTAPATTPDVRRHAAFSLKNIADPASAPALHRALQLDLSPQALYSVVGALERLHYAPAAPDILRRLEAQPREVVEKVPQEAALQGYYASALASLRYQPAIPALESLSSTKTFTAEWVSRNQQTLPQKNWAQGIALMRLTAPWGESAGGVRLLLLPSENPESAPPRIAIAMENTGTSAQPLLSDPRGVLIVDGQRHPVGMLIADGNPYLEVDKVFTFIIDISSWIKDDREHRVEYELGTAVSNTLIVKAPIGAAPSGQAEKP